ncbi:hypothetical protein TrCOL_g100 [Triparma columacea]|uniref:Cilia- and flagella-associated protein 157 n=1 Tax=Triparma columacea TaxID=722753 RepID=A0A9W7GCG8_9STRA|nr:hypothetical protein TrCOL_g100 [Triparma columacea]
MSEEPEISAEDAELASNLALASEVSTQLEDELVLTSLTGLKTTIEESEGRIKRAEDRLTKMKSEGSSTSIYLQQKIADNFVTIERLEKEIRDEQESRRHHEFSLIDKMLKNKESFSIRLEALRHELKEKTSDLEVITEFKESQKETKVRLDGIRTRLEEQREKHKLARQNLSHKLESELSRIERTWEEQLSSTRESLLRMTEDALDEGTRRVMMETEKMEGEVVYQDKEAAKLKVATRTAGRIRKELRGQLKEAERMEQSGAKKAYMYTRIIRKLRAMVEERRGVLASKVDHGGNAESTREMNRAKGDARLRELVDLHREANARQREYNGLAAEARDKIDVLRKCRTGVVDTMLEALGEFYEDGDEDEGSVALGWREEEEEEKLERLKLHRGYTSDLLGSSEDARSRQSQVLDTEASMIESIVGDDPSLRAIFGLGDWDEEEGEGGEEEDDDDGKRFTSIADLRPDRRTGYLRRLIAKVHGFQISEGYAEGGEEGGGGGVEEDVGSPGSSGGGSFGGTLPPIGNPSGTSNMLTSLLGGDAPPMPRRFFEPVREPRPLRMNAGTQTDGGEGAREARERIRARARAEEEAKTRRRLHRGVDSPGYDPGSIISVGGDGGLWRRFGGGGEGKRRAPPPLPEGRVPHSHRGIAVERRGTPERELMALAGMME